MMSKDSLDTVWLLRSNVIVSYHKATPNCSDTADISFFLIDRVLNHVAFVKSNLVADHIGNMISPNTSRTRVFIHHKLINQKGTPLGQDREGTGNWSVEPFNMRVIDQVLILWTVWIRFMYYHQL